MVARIIAVLMFVATMTVASPADATALTVDSVTCWATGSYPSDPANYGTYSCAASVSGGTGSYSYSWWVSSGWSSGGPWPGGQTMNGVCKYGQLRINQVTVTDSSHATASGSAGIVC
jgi:hypothetical protein